ncbi:MAG: peptidoglycan DD-metalloendopeptidase family protein, partial [Clostridia bacterium]|nr:peptidoglycan DD-metalloendopeptidase family protein [Clostridia bacterium]
KRPMMSSWGFVLLDTTIKGTLLLVPVLLVSRLARRLSSEWKHMLLLAGILSFVAMPAVYALLSLIQVPSLHTVVEPVTLNEKITREGVRNFIQAESLPTQGEPSVAVANSLWSLIINSKLMSILWGLGFAWVLGRALLGRFLARSTTRKARKDLSEERLELFLELCERLKIKKNIRLLVIDREISPLTFGYLKPVILLPGEVQSWSKERLQLVLLHELSHIRRGDNLTQLVTQIVSALYWFNPILWLAVKRLRVEQENACDIRVLNSGVKPSTYASHLLDILRMYYSPRFLSEATNPMGRVCSTEKRIVSILDTAVSRAILNFRSVSWSAFMLILLILPSFFINIVRTDARERADYLLVQKDSAGRFSITNGVSIHLTDLKRQVVPLGSPLNQSVLSIQAPYSVQSQGLDLLVNKPLTPVIATADGIVQYTGTDARGQKYLIIRHANGLSTVYTGFNEACVALGQRVNQGEEIGCTGNNKTFHYEIRIGSYSTDPVAFLK